MTKFTATALCTALALANTAALSGPLVKQLTIPPGKGISFFMGGQQGTAIFTQDSGACGLTVTIAQAQAPESMSGMSGSMVGNAKASSMRVQVMPARPARFDTPDGQQLVFNCGPDGTQMFLEMPSEFKYTDK